MIRINCWGLAGPSGALPPHYTALLLRAKREKNDAAAAFLDLFVHRSASLLYRAWEKARPGPSYERYVRESRRRPLHSAPTDPAQLTSSATSAVARSERSNDEAGQPDPPLVSVLRSTAGVEGPHLSQRTAVPDDVIVSLAGLLSRRQRSAHSLTAVLHWYLNVPVRVIQLLPRWLELPLLQRTQLGGENSQLGMSAVAGDRVLDRSGSFRIRLGPLSLEEYRKLLPEARQHRQLVDLTRLFAGLSLDFDLQLVLRGSELPAAIFPRAGDSHDNRLRGPALGRTAFLLSPSSKGSSRPKPGPDFDRAIFPAPLPA